jgi:hypothetical protein
MVLVNGDNKLLPLTVKVAVTEPTDALGVTTIVELVDDVGVPFVILQAYVGDVIAVVTAVKVAVVGVKAPPALTEKPV